MLKKLDYLRRSLKQSLRDFVLGPYYVLDGQRFIVPNSAPVGARRGLSQGRYEAPERRLVRQFLPTDIPVIELGGSYGIVSNVIRRHISSDQLHVIVEANLDLLPICAHNVFLAGSAETVEFLNVAIGYGPDGCIQFEDSTSHHGNKIYTSKNPAVPTRLVKSMRLGDLTKRYIDNSAYSLVCDIEGGELEMLKQDGDALRNCQCLVLEIHPSVFSEMGSSVEEVEALLVDAGLKIVARDQDVLVALRD
jgi:FkbM family methyltransferase